MLCFFPPKTKKKHNLCLPVQLKKCTEQETFTNMHAAAFRNTYAANIVVF